MIPQQTPCCVYHHTFATLVRIVFYHLHAERSSTKTFFVIYQPRDNLASIFGYFCHNRLSYYGLKKGSGKKGATKGKRWLFGGCVDREATILMGIDVLQTVLRAQNEWFLEDSNEHAQSPRTSNHVEANLFAGKAHA